MPSKWLTAFRSANPHFSLNPRAVSAISANSTLDTPKTEDFRQFRPARPCSDEAVPIAANTAISRTVSELNPAIGTNGRYWHSRVGAEATDKKPAQTLEFRSTKSAIGTNGTGISVETDPETPPELPQDLVPGTELHVSVDTLVADLKTVFMGDGPESEAAERLAKAKVADGPVGDGLPAWQSWMNRRYTVWRTRGFSRTEALGIVWGEAEAEWHKRHGAAPDPDRCAGCGERMPVGTGQRLLDGAIVHIGDPEQVECLAIYGAQWRAAASAGLMALGLMRPQL